jgi:predicted ArsR family transcriptional regulator
MPDLPPGGQRPATEEEARTLASAIRLRILRLCLDRALTNKEIAARLGVNPATTLHHVRRLVAAEFLAPQAERRGARGAREVPYLSTGKSWTLDVSEHTVPGSGRAVIDAFLDEIRHIDDGTEAANDPFTRLGLRLPPDQIDELRTRLVELLQEFASRPLDPDGLPYSVFLAVYPDVTRA